MELKTTFEHYYPENSIGGECALFAEKLKQFGPVGNTLASKTDYVKKHGILLPNLGGRFEIGDVVITSESPTNGHVFIVNDIIGNQLQATESNFKLDDRVHHTRIVPVSNKIIGVLRGCPLKVQMINPNPMAPSPLTFPIQIQTTLLMNKQPKWNSLLTQMADLQNWFWVNSQQKIELIINYMDVDIGVFPTVVTGGNQSTLSEIIEPTWYDTHIMPLFSPKSQIIMLILKKADFTGIVYGPGREVGYCYEPKYPIRGFVAIDEADDYPPAISGLSGLSKLVAHEIAHGLYGIALNDTTPCGGRNYVLPQGSDLCHAHYYGESGYPQNFIDIFQDFDYAKLNQVIN